MCAQAPSHVDLFATPWTVAQFCPWDSTGKNTGMDFHAFLQGLFPDSSLPWQVGSLPLSHQGRPVCWIRDIINKHFIFLVLAEGQLTLEKHRFELLRSYT